MGCECCGTVHHRECWDENGSHCAVHACDGETSYVASLTLSSGKPLTTPAQRRPQGPTRAISPGVSAQDDQLAFRLVVAPQRETPTVAIVVIALLLIGGPILHGGASFLAALLMAVILLLFALLFAALGRRVWAGTEVYIDRHELTVTHRLGPFTRVYRFDPLDQVEIRRVHAYTQGSSPNRREVFALEMTVAGRKTLTFAQDRSEVEHHVMIEMIERARSRFAELASRVRPS